MLKARFPFFCASLLILGLELSTGTSVFAGARPLGIDVSSFQAHPVWTSVKGDGVSFAWAKATEGVSITDADYVYNQTNGKAAGVIMGSYDFAHPENNAPASEASHFWGVVNPYTLADGKTLIPMLDMEVFSGHVGATTYSAWANDWCADIVADAAANGVAIKPAIYVSACNACEFNTSVSQWFSDIADYNGENAFTGTPWSTCTSCEEWGSGVWHFWQVSSTGAISGISGNVDLDVYNAATLPSTVIASAANSAIYYWDLQGTGGANPITSSLTGTWENNDWSTSSAGQATPTAWVNGKAACFGVHTGIGTPAFTVTMNSSHVVAGFFDGPLNPNACNVTITGTGVITLASGAQGCYVHNASDGSLAVMTINNEIAGDGQLVPQGSGNIFLNGANSYSGGTQIGFLSNSFSGILTINNGSALGTGPISLTKWGNGGAISAAGTSAITIPNDVTLVDPTTNNFAPNAGGLTVAGDWTLGANAFTLETGATAGRVLTLSGSVSGSAAFTVADAGILVLSGVNTYTGPTTISSGSTLTIGGAGQLHSGAYAGNIAANGTFNYGSSSAQTLSGVISGASALTVSNGGTLTLTGVNTYSGGTTVKGGATAIINANSGLGSAATALTLDGGCLENNSTSLALSSGRTITLGANGGYLDANGTSATPMTVSSKLTGAGRLLINLDDAPVVLANTTNNYTGDTIIGTNGPGSSPTGTHAWLKLGAAGVVPNGAGKGNVTINQSYLGMLDLAGFAQTINGLSGDGVVDNSFVNGSLSVGSNDQTSTFSGVIQNSTGTLSLTKVGAGVLTLAGSNTYSGSTTISAGTLALGSTGSINNTPFINLAAGATFDVSAQPAYVLGASNLLTASGTASPATIKGGTTVDIGSRNIRLNYDGSHPALVISQGGLLMNGPVFTINGPALPIGTYTVIQQTTGNITLTGNNIIGVNGTVFGPGMSGGITVVGGNVNLFIRAGTSFTNLAASQSVTYGATNITLSGTVTGTGSIYPPAGDAVAITINGNTQFTTINDATGDFSISYNPASIPASASPYTISYLYSGDDSFVSSLDTTRTLTVNSRTVALTGTRPFDGTTIAAASILSVTNALAGDVVTVASGSGTLASSNAGVQLIASFGDLALGGTSSSNYTLIGASGSVTITSTSFSITGGTVDSTGSNFIITWQSVPGATYQILGYTDLLTSVSNWTNIGSPIMASNVITSATNPMSSPQQFFHVKQQ